MAAAVAKSMNLRAASADTLGISLDETTTREDVVALAAPVLRHRLLLSFAAEAEQKSADDVVASLLRSVPLGR